MSTTEPDRSEDGGPDITAGEYVVGVLDADARAAAERQIAADPAFAAQVSTWEARLTPLLAEIASVAPPASLWPAIATGLFPAWQASRPQPARLWDSLGLWRGLALGATALAVASLAVAILPRAPVSVPTPLAPPLALARLEGKEGVAFVATLDQVHGRLIVTPTGRPAQPGKSQELWLMPPKAAPVPLGVFMEGKILVAAIPPGLTPESLLGVSLEPLGGSPSGAPTGPVIAQGQLMRL